MMQNTQSLVETLFWRNKNTSFGLKSSFLHFDKKWSIITLSTCQEIVGLQNTELDESFYRMVKHFNYRYVTGMLTTADWHTSRLKYAE